MTLLSTFFTLLLITTAVLSAPTANLKRRSFEVPRVRRANYVPHGPAALRKAYGKFNITAAHLGFEPLDFQAVKQRPSGAVNASNSTNGTQDGSVAAVATTGDTEFVAAVTVGGQTMMMDFDTGSSDM